MSANSSFRSHAQPPLYVLGVVVTRVRGLVGVVDIEGNLLNVEDDVVDIEDNLLNVEDDVVDIEDNVLNVEDDVVDVEDNLLNVDDDVIDVEDKNGGIVVSRFRNW
jgi:hypothetical protein